MSNQIIGVRGVDKTVGNLLHAIPDAELHLAEGREIMESLEKHLRELAAARTAVKMAEAALSSDIHLCDQWLSRGEKTVTAWRKDIENGAEDLSLAFPALGFRIVKNLPEMVLVNGGDAS